MQVARLAIIQRQVGREGKSNILIWDFYHYLVNLLQMVKSLSSTEGEKLAILLRTVRSESGWTQAQVADRLQLPQSFVSKYESGERRLDLVELRQICKALRISLADFVRRFERDIS